MKTNFKQKKQSKIQDYSKSNSSENKRKELTQEEFEEFVSKSGAAGSFMIFRSKNKNDELGLEQL
jgi:hypothetical protein